MKCCICKESMNLGENVYCATEAIRVFDMPHKIKYGETKLFRCPNCSHMQIENMVENGVYEDEYNVDYSSWEIMQKTDEFYFNKMCTLLEENNNILEIGCGEGRSLEIAQRFFKNVYGIEPAARQAEMAKKRVNGIVINDFFTSEYKLPKVFDAFYSKMVFEHLENPLEILKNLYRYLKPGGIGWLNVPNGQKIYNENLYELFSYVHIQYYTPLSISFLLSMAGFEIIEIDTHADKRDEIVDIDVIFRKPNKECGKFVEQRKIDIDTIKANILPSERVTIWGAGTKSHKYIELFDDEINVQHIVDKSERKQGKFISKLNIPIEAVSRVIIDESDVVVIFASLYNKEILEELRAMKFKGKIMMFEKGNIKIFMLNK